MMQNEYSILHPDTARLSFRVGYAHYDSSGWQSERANKLKIKTGSLSKTFFYANKHAH